MLGVVWYSQYYSMRSWCGTTALAMNRVRVVQTAVLRVMLGDVWYSQYYSMRSWCGTTALAMNRSELQYEILVWRNCGAMNRVRVVQTALLRVMFGDVWYSQYYSMRSWCGATAVAMNRVRVVQIAVFRVMLGDVWYSQYYSMRSGCGATAVAMNRFRVVHKRYSCYDWYCLVQSELQYEILVAQLRAMNRVRVVLVPRYPCYVW
ncbi:hypothetical protein J6590_084245 [Homalodisca vitripennis]|nr:hypothetical protein J6590_084245 [Homalodisca vitripennis]